MHFTDSYLCKCLSNDCVCHIKDNKVNCFKNFDLMILFLEMICKDLFIYFLHSKHNFFFYSNYYFYSFYATAIDIFTWSKKIKIIFMNFMFHVFTNIKYVKNVNILKIMQVNKNKVL